MVDKKEVIEKKLAQSKSDLEKEKIQMKTILNQIQSYQKKFAQHGLRSKELEARIGAFQEMLKD